MIWRNETKNNKTRFFYDLYSDNIFDNISDNILDQS